MWYQDIEAKKNREDMEARDQAERNQKVAAILKEQMQVLEKQREEEKRLRIENSRLIVNVYTSIFSNTQSLCVLNSNLNSFFYCSIFEGREAEH